MNRDVHRYAVRDPHDILGVPRGADRRQVTQAFRRKARQGGHPDFGGDNQTFDDLVRARDALLASARHTTSDVRRHPPHAAARASARPAPAEPDRVRDNSAPMSKLAVATAVLALLGPLTWPAAILVGHLALRQIKRTGRGGGTLVTVVLFFLYILTTTVLLPILSLTVLP